MINNTELKKITDRIAVINLSELAKSYEEYSYDYDCRCEAKQYDAQVAAFAKSSSKVTVAWYENVLAFSKKYKGQKDVLKYVTKQDELKVLLDKGSQFQAGSANYLDELFQSLLAMPKSRQKLERGRELAADFDKQPKLVTSQCKVINKTSIASFLATLKTEETFLDYEDQIASLAAAKTRNIAWCDKVDALWSVADKEKLTNCDNYNVLKELKVKADYVRLEDECKEYTAAIVKGAGHEKVLALNKEVGKHLTACRTVIADFDKKWSECVKNAEQTVKDLNDQMERARMEKECKDYLTALAGTDDYEMVLKINKDVGKHITSLHKLVPDFDKKWSKCVGNAEKLAQQAKNKADRLRMEKECKDYVAALAGNVGFDKVLELDKSVSKHLDSLHKLLPDFDEDWEICVSNAHILYERQADEWYNLAIKADTDIMRFEYFRNAADYNHPFAMYQVGKCYQEGKGIEQSNKAAFNWYQKALDNGVQVANFALGYCYRYKIGCLLDYKKAFAFFSKYIDSDNLNSRELCAWELGLCYEKGEGTTKDKSKAFSYYELAAKLGNAQAMYDVGRCYANGIGVSVSEDNALAWYERGEALGHSDSKKQAEAIRKTRKINQLNNEIDACYFKAKRGDVNAQYELAEYYFTGNGVTQSYKDAFIWYEKAAKHGHRKAMERLGDCYFNGYGTKQSYSAAEKWYKKSMK